MENLDDDLSSFDPFSIFEVNTQLCYLIKVTVIRGRNITKGKLQDALDTPDPYVKLHLVESPFPVQYTTNVCCDDPNPEWNEEFEFLFIPKVQSKLKIELWESNLLSDDLIDDDDYDLDLIPVDKSTRVTIDFKGTSEVDLELLKTVCDHSDVRFGLTLCDAEKQFLKERKERVFHAMRDVLGEEGPNNLAEVPVIGVMGSGGGFRAMTGYCGVLSALYQTRIVDMATYIAGLSGSSWYLGHLYSHADWPKRDPKDLWDSLKMNITKPWIKRATTVHFISRFLKEMKEKRERQQSVSLTDFYGHVLDDLLLDGKRSACLSQQSEKITKGELPMPLYTAVRVKPDTSAKDFHEWVEFSPYEINMPKYGISVSPEHFSSKFYHGHLIERFPEPKLHFLLGIFGSAFAILFKRVLQKSTPTSEENGEVNKHTKSDDVDGSPTEDNDGQNVIPLSELEDEVSVDQVVFDTVNNNDMDSQPLDQVNKRGTDYQRMTSPDRCADGFTYLEQTEEYLLKGGDSYQVLNNLEEGVNNTTDDAHGRSFNIEEDFDIVDNSEEAHNCVTNSVDTKTELEVGNKQTHKPTLYQRVLQTCLNSESFNSRHGRAAKVLNFASGIPLPLAHAFSPFYNADEKLTDDTDVDEKLSEARTMYVVDAGLSINLPIPALLRPQRYLDLILSFDFSSRSADSDFPFKALLQSEEWARQRGVPFPPITVTKETVAKEGIKECYVFRDPQNDLCPIVVHFNLVNDSFRRFKQPGVPRETEEEQEFGNFSIFDDESKPYSTFNFTYTDKSFDRLTQLMAYNTMNHIEVIYGAIIECVNRRRQRSKMAKESWELSRIVSMAARNFSKLVKKPEVSAEGLVKMERLVGRKADDAYLRRYRLPRMEGMLGDAPTSEDDEGLAETLMETAAEEVDDVEGDENERLEKVFPIGEPCGCGDEDCDHNPEEEDGHPMSMMKNRHARNSSVTEELVKPRESTGFGCCVVL